MRIVDLAIALIFFIASAGATAFVMAVFISFGLGVAPAVLRLDALMSAGVFAHVLLMAMATTNEKED